MEKTVTLNLRVNPVVKQQAESVLKQLGIPMSTAIDMYLRQISMKGGIPFAVSLPGAPESIDASRMTEQQIHEAVSEGYADACEGRVLDAQGVFAVVREQRDDRV